MVMSQQQQQTTTQSPANPFNVPVDACELGLPGLQLARVLANDEKHSASSAIIAFGAIAQQQGAAEVAVKISFAVHPRRQAIDNSLEVERDIYQHVVPLMAAETPNLLRFVGVFECRDFEEALLRQTTTSATSTAIALSILKNMWDMRDDGLGITYAFWHAYLLVTEKSAGTPLKKWYKFINTYEEAEKNVFMIDVLVQIAHTLRVFRKFGLMHNDLHDGNIFVRRLAEPFRMLVEDAEGKQGVRYIRYFIEIFDFDHGAKVATNHNTLVIRNTMLDTWACRELGECNAFIENRDWFNIIYYIWIGTDDPAVEVLLPPQLRIEPTNDMRKSHGSSRGYLAWSGRPCICLDGACRECRTDVAGLQEMYGPDQFLMDFVFNSEASLGTAARQVVEADGDDDAYDTEMRAEME